MIDRPGDVGAYYKWLRDTHGLPSRNRVLSQYEAVAGRLHTHFTALPFWSSLDKTLNDIHAAYTVKTGYPLLTTVVAPQLVSKPFDSFLEKTYRKNVVDNRQWDQEPGGGWLLPDGWFSQVRDIVRTTIVVKYLDGVGFLAEAFAAAAQSSGITARVDYEASDAGYYAAHIDLEDDVSVPTITFDPITIRGHLEVQVTTQVKDLIKRLLHQHYEAARVQSSQNSLGPPWQWNYRTTEFVANYLGHVLHYVEGMIVEVRDRQTTENSAKPHHKEGHDVAR